MLLLTHAVHEVGSAPPARMDPKAFCEQWTGLPLDQVDCRTARAVADLEGRSAGEAQPLLQQVRQEAERTQQWLTALRESVLRAGAHPTATAAALVSLESRQDAANRLLQVLPATYTADTTALAALTIVVGVAAG